MGDPAGIGPEIVVKALTIKETYEKCRPIVTGDAKVMEWAAKQLGADVKINAIANVSEAKFEYGTIDVYDLNCIDMDTFEPGKVAPQCGNAAFVSIIKAIELAMAGEVDGIAGLPGCCRAEDANEVDFSCEVFVQDLLDIDFFGRRQLGHRWYRGERFLCHNCTKIVKKVKS